MYININITFMHISWFILVSKSTSFTFFIWIFSYIITFFMGDLCTFTHFFHRKIMRGCRLAICLYDIRQTSYERRLHHSHVAPSVPIWAEFTSTLGNIYPHLIWAATPVLSHATPAAIIYRHILLVENSFDIIRTRAHEKIQVDFFRAESVYVLYIAGENVKKCKVRSCLCPLDPSIFHFIWVKHGEKIW